MPLLNPGDQFPRLTITTTGDQTLTLFLTRSRAISVSCCPTGAPEGCYRFADVPSVQLNLRVTR
jgi:hypothetical protein